MKKNILSAIFAAVAIMMPGAAFADGFVAGGGVAEGCHFATEATVAAHSSTAGGYSVHHGMLTPVDPASAAGIGSVAAPSSLSLSYDASTRTVMVLGASSSARVAVVAMDGRNINCILTDFTFSLSNLAKGIYIVRVADGDALATLKIAL